MLWKRLDLSRAGSRIWWNYRFISKGLPEKHDTNREMMQAAAMVASAIAWARGFGPD